MSAAKWEALANEAIRDAGEWKARARQLEAALGVAIECMRTTAETGDDGASDQCIAECLAVFRKATL